MEYLLRVNIWGRQEKDEKKTWLLTTFAESEHLGKTGKGWEKTGLLTVSICWEWTFGEDRGKGREKTGLLTVSICWEWTFGEDRKRARKDWITGSEYLLRVNIWGRQEKGEKRLDYRQWVFAESERLGKAGKGQKQTGLRTLEDAGDWHSAEIHFSKQKDGWQWVTSHPGQGWRMAAHSEDNAWSIIHGYIAKRNSNGTDWLKHINLIVEAILSLVGWK